MKKLKIFAIILLLTIASCKKKNADPEPDLPPETQSGANTFGCYLNGVPWKPSPRSFGNPTLYIQLDGPYFVLKATNNEGVGFERIDFFSNKVNFDREGTYSLKKSTIFDNSVGFFGSIYLSSKDLDVIEDGMLTITKFDTQKQFVSGRFWFKLQKNDGTTIEAKDGRFDLKF